MRNSLKSLVAAAVVVSAASAAHAAIITYLPNLTSGGLTISNITETNNSASDKYYGAPTLNGTILSFPMITGTLPFASQSSGAGDSDLLDVKLSFDVSSTAPISVAAFLDEVGDYFDTGTGTSGDGASMLIFGPNDALLAAKTSTFTAAAGSTSGIWDNSIGLAGPGLGVALGFHVVIDNVLHTNTIAAGDSALIEKKGVLIDIGVGTNPNGGGPGTPEPASLGLLGLGAVTLVARRRKA